ncbi:MAG: pyrroline-5-carboxylate reductase [Clostridia bacterium]|nr:pyrroline-5-carboxylate reductase [Clostridia bacterium]
MRKFEIGIIGCGNMSVAIWQGILDAGLAKGSDIIVSDTDEVKLQYASDRGLSVTRDNKDILLAKYIIFAVKPQIFSEVANALCGKTGDSVLISIMAGINSAKIKSLTGSAKIARIMPNTPCMVKKGVSAVSFCDVGKSEQEYILQLFRSIGEVIEIPEAKFDAVTSVSGSGPAYIYMFLDGMIKGGIRGGLTYEESKKLAVATMQGAAEMVRQKETPLDELVQAVCSKGGTTIEAVNIYRQKELVELIGEGIEACRKRSEELSKL